MHTLWLCVMLNTNKPYQHVCWHPTTATCEQAMHEWFVSAFAYANRTKIGTFPFAICHDTRLQKVAR